MNITLYNISNEQKGLMDEIEAAEGEITPEIAEKIQFTEELFHDKAIDYGYVIKSFEDTSDTIAKEIKRLQELKKKADNNAERLRAKITEAMIQFGVSEITTPTLKLSFRKSEAVEVYNEALLPAKFIEFKPQANKMEIKKALKLGEQVDGASLVVNQNLQIK